MDRFVSDIRQLGYVVSNIEGAMDYWTKELSVGPWYYTERLAVTEFTYHDQSVDPYVSVGLANLGPMQIELIEPRDDAPNLYNDFLASGLSGMQHFAYWTEDFDAAAAVAGTAEFTIVQRGLLGPRGRFAYFQSHPQSRPSLPGTTIELSEVLGQKKKFYQLIHDEAADWDGRDPIRPFPDLSTL